MCLNRICWVTPDYFIDCDISLIPQLCNHGYYIDWIVTGPNNKPRYTFDVLPKHKNLSIERIEWHGRLYHPRNIVFFIKLFREILSKSTDMYYVNYAPEGWFMLFYWMLPFKRSIVTAHQGRVHEAFRFPLVAKTCRWLYYRKAKYVNMFSDYQAKLFQNSYKPKHLFVIPLMLKDFGEPKKQRNLEECRFLSFGTISFNKNVELLIDAAELLYNRGYTQFRVSINGVCANWADYQKHIIHPEIFELSIRQIDNEEISDLFNSSTFFVQPYRILTQSGPTKIAFRYNLPIIASDKPTFVDEVKEDIAGFIFKSEDVDSLASVMACCINMKQEEYKKLCTRMREYVEKSYSDNVVVGKYLQMFRILEDEIK